MFGLSNLQDNVAWIDAVGYRRLEPRRVEESLVGGGRDAVEAKGLKYGGEEGGR
jgi:hypothetical protein